LKQFFIDAVSVFAVCTIIGQHGYHFLFLKKIVCLAKGAIYDFDESLKDESLAHEYCYFCFLHDDNHNNHSTNIDCIQVQCSTRLLHCNTYRYQTNISSIKFLKVIPTQKWC